MSLLDIIFAVATELLRLFWWAIVLAGLVQTLVSFGVLDSRNRIVWSIGDFLYRVTEPVLRPIRRRVPNFGGVDISFIAALLLIWICQMLLAWAYTTLKTGSLQGSIL